MKEHISLIFKEGRIGPGAFRDRNGLSEFIRYCRNNEISYYALLLLRDQGILPPETLGLINKEEELYREMVDTTLYISRALKEENLRFFFMKTFRAYPYTDHDMDLVIVDKDKSPEYIRVINKAGYELHKNRSSLREPGKMFYIRAGSEWTGPLPKLHLHYGVSWNGIRFFDASDIWLRLKPADVRAEKISLPSGEDEILILAAHAVYENGYLTLGELLHIKNILDRAETLDTEYMLKTSKSYNWNSAFKLYLAYANACYKDLTGEYLLNKDLGARLGIPSLSVKIDTFPYFLPPLSLLAAYGDRLLRDICILRLRWIPRQILNLTLVIWILRLKKRLVFNGGI